MPVTTNHDRYVTATSNDGMSTHSIFARWAGVWNKGDVFLTITGREDGPTVMLQLDELMEFARQAALMVKESEVEYHRRLEAAAQEEEKRARFGARPR